MGERFYSKVQFGKENPAARGTAVAATKILSGRVPAVGSDREPHFPREDVGIRAPAVRAVIDKYHYANTLQIPDGYFQALPFFFGGGLKGAVTPVEQTASQGDYLWNFTPGLSFGTYNAPDSFTIELGDDTQAFEVEYCLFDRIRISGEVGEGMSPSPVTIEGGFFGRQLTPTTFTGALSLPNQEGMSAKLSRFYLDTAWSGIGGTEKANILRGFDIEILTGNHPKPSGSGYKYFNTHGEGIYMVTANFTFEGNSDADAIFDAHQAKTFQAVRLKVEGSQIGSGLNHSLTIDIGGEWKNVSPLASEALENNLHTAVLFGRYESVGAKEFQVSVVTNSNAY